MGAVEKVSQVAGTTRLCFAPRATVDSIAQLNMTKVTLHARMHTPYYLTKRLEPPDRREVFGGSIECVWRVSKELGFLVLVLPLISSTTLDKFLFLSMFGYTCINLASSVCKFDALISACMHMLDMPCSGQPNSILQLPSFTPCLPH